MQDILSILPPGSVVLDLGSGSGSFAPFPGPLRIIYADLHACTSAPTNFVICDASSLPFADSSIDAVILNNSLEHFHNLSLCIREIARVLSPKGFLYIAVPDATTLTDRIYRWLDPEQHINHFTSIDDVPRLFADAISIPLAGVRILHSSMSFLNRNNIAGRLQRKMVLFANGNEAVLRWLNLIIRYCDRLFNTRMSIYGWAYFFGRGVFLNGSGWSNVCVRCGSGHPSSFLIQSGLVVRRRLLPAVYSCPRCGVRNFFIDDRS